MSFENAMAKLNLDLDSSFYDPTAFPQLPLQELTVTKAAIEGNLESLFAALQNVHKCDMDTPLLSRDGFPRSDIDVVQVRLIRTQIIRLRNDLRSLLQCLNIRLEEFFQSGAAPAEITLNSEPSVDMVPFAVVNEVVAHSPAYKAGLQDGDELISFAETINATNHDGLKRVVATVQSSVANRNEIKVLVLRNKTDKIGLCLRPCADWGGRGVLGCRLDKL
ncbi:hypothetical protein BABINDRAFT_172847 [Babjeviella inositovora NRRL Y-12698]|uniref:Probable 26S proteasome regulatory subunit p27 n=1 Tax=Babjeviella inositovora NRRL Y-12698 TaxID=984486 RepID=A0A1E3QIM2_9ASCO|nr:uncharacterized protein BABINDRAFT_172847 [Babjeviella inositovora NRRL Y-12698]ODQ77539.1 hypothetical protein BABINDRAFT_172847 [Babjeviella inositovora NRRL Y-12698]